MEIDILNKKIKTYNKEQIHFTNYCLIRMEDRVIIKDPVYDCLLHNKILKANTQEALHKGIVENRYKLTFKISSKYFLLVIVSFEQSILKVINVIKTSKDLEKKWRKKISK